MVSVPQALYVRMSLSHTNLCFPGHYVKKIVSGDHSFQILTQTGRLFGNGYNSTNQLMLEGAAASQDVTRLTESDPSKDIVV